MFCNEPQASPVSDFVVLNDEALADFTMLHGGLGALAQEFRAVVRSGGEILFQDSSGKVGNKLNKQDDIDEWNRQLN